MPTIEMKKFDIMSVAKIYAILMAIFGFIVGLMTAIAGAAIGGAAGAAVPGMGAAIGGMALAAIIIMPIMYAIFGFIAGAIGAWLYNLVAERIGGIQFEH